MDIIIDEQFRTIIPPLTEDELSRLEDSIMTDGVRDKLVVWNNTLIDGHNRYRIATTLGIPFETISMEFESREHALNWVISNQLGRRNLNPNQIAYLRGKRYEVEKKLWGAPIGNENAKKQSGNIYHIEKSNQRTGEDLASEYGVSEKTIRNNATFSKALDILPSEKKQEILSGEDRLTQNEASIITKLDPPIQKKVIKEIESGVSVSDAINKFDEDAKRRENDERIKRDIERNRKLKEQMKFNKNTMYQHNDITECSKSDLIDNESQVRDNVVVWLITDSEVAHKLKIEARKLFNLKFN